MDTPASWLFWICFHFAITLLLYLDFKVFFRNAETSEWKKAFQLSVFWVLIALSFNLFLYFSFGSDVALQFFTAYLIEKSLSVDNLFLFLLIFTSFQITKKEQRKVLVWGMLGAFVFRLIFILVGVSLIQAFHWILYLFGIFLFITGVKLLFQKEKKLNLTHSYFFLFIKKMLPLSQSQEKGCFFIKEEGKVKCTLLFLVLLLIEWTDVIFALDSIPAVFSITRNPFIAYTSNVFAVLGLRALFFLLSYCLEKLHYLKIGLAVILIFVGTKMFIEPFYVISLPASLMIILAILLMTVLFSLKKDQVKRN